MSSKHTVKRSFTSAQIAALKRPAKGWTFHRDPGTAHLFVGVSRTGTRAYFWYGKVARDPQRIKLGPFPEMAPEVAAAKAAAITREHSEGKGAADLHALARSDMTLKQLFDEFLQKRRLKRSGHFLAPYTRRLYQHWFDKHLKKFHDTPVAAIGKRDIERLHEKIGRASRTSANRSVTILSAMYQYAAERGYYAGENPARGITPFPEHSRERFLHGDEMFRFLQAVAAEENTDIRDAILLLLLTGARKANVLGMRWQDIALNRAEWTLPAESTKSRRSQTVPLVEQAVAILQSRGPRDAGHVFPSSGKHGHLVYPDSGWQRILARAGLKDLRMHDLRRTLGSWQAQLGASLLLIGKSLGHSDQRSTMIYARLDTDPVRASVARAVNAMYEAPSEPIPQPKLHAVKGG